MISELILNKTQTIAQSGSAVRVAFKQFITKTPGQAGYNVKLIFTVKDVEVVWVTFFISEDNFDAFERTRDHKLKELILKTDDYVDYMKSGLTSLVSKVS